MSELQITQIVAASLLVLLALVNGRRGYWKGVVKSPTVDGSHLDSINNEAIKYQELLEQLLAANDEAVVELRKTCDKLLGKFLEEEEEEEYVRD